MSERAPDNWEKPGSGGWEKPGAGGGGTPGRVVPDSHDVIVYFNQPLSSYNYIPNSGSGGSLNVTLAGALQGGPGSYGDAGVLNASTSVGTQGGVLYSGTDGTTIGEADTITLSCWVWIMQGVAYGGDMAIFGKAAHPSSWSSPFHCALLGLLNDGTPEFVVRQSVDWLSIVGASVLSLASWHHVGLTYDGTTLTAYVDGAAVGTATGTAIDWSSHGGILIGGWPNNSGFYDSSPVNGSDYRWADVVRPPSYFSEVWATRRTP